MDREKILVNFRTFKPYKDGLDKLAAKQGKTVTQYLNHLIFDQIKADIMNDADADAIRQIVLKFNLPERIFNQWVVHSGFDKLLDELVIILGNRETALKCINEWQDLFFQNIKSYCNARGIDQNDVEYNEVMKAFTEKTNG